jgi:hypothetical protein
VQRTEYDRLAFMPALLPSDDFASADDCRRMHVALHPHLAASILSRHRVIVRAVVSQQQRTDPRGDFIAGFVWSDVLLSEAGFVNISVDGVPLGSICRTAPKMRHKRRIEVNPADHSSLGRLRIIGEHGAPRSNEAQSQH